MAEPDDLLAAGPPTVELDGPAPTIMERLAPGTLLGRYILTSAIGEGGAGVVYAAYDPKLDRRLAIKLVRPLARSQAGLLREAQGMARLSHPNVVVVHDVGTRGDEVFLAMEFVDGGTLREWLRIEPRSPRAILETFQAAGRGLAAAHAAGFVHRDFKPDNVLVGRDGSVRVTDFGLARAAATSPGVEEDPDAEVIVGTPGYMAPEQYTKGAPDPRSDQFAFCVSLYDALHRRMPFGGDTEEEMRALTLAGKPAVPDRAAKIPAHIERAVMRGLSGERDARFASMADLLAELARDPTARLRRIAAVVLAACAAAAGTWGVRSMLTHDAHLCRGAETHLAGVWDEPLRARIHSAFAATGVPYAEGTFERVAGRLDHFAGDWVAMRTEACEAARVRGEQSEQVLTLRMACLDTRLREMGALVQVMEVSDRDVVKASVEASEKLSPITMCGDIAALTAPVPPPADAHARDEIVALRGRLADARARESAGKFADALAADQGLLDEARRTGYSPLVAESLVDLGVAETGAGRYDEAERTLREASDVADEAHHDEARGKALVQLADVTGRWLGHYALAADYATSAVHVARRLGDERLESIALEQASREHAYIEEIDRALDEARQSIVLTDRLFGSDELRRARVRSTMAVALGELGRFRESEENDRIALATAERVLGANHPSLDMYLQDLALDFVWSGRPAEAIPLDQRACDIALRELGPDHPRYADALNNLAYAENDLGHFTEGLALNTQALAIFERRFGPDHAENVYALVGMGEALLGLGDAARALPLLERATHLAEAVGIEAETMGDCHFHYGLALWQVATAGKRNGDEKARAIALVARSVTEYGKAPRLEPRRRRAEEWLAKYARAADGAH